MDFAHSPRAQELQQRITAFFDAHIYPNEKQVHAEIEENTRRGERWTPIKRIEELKAEAKSAGLWNLFLPDSELGAGLSNLEYAPLAEITGRVLWSPEVFNCSAPDTGNMEILARYGTPAQKERWLKPLLAGEIRSAFAMTEPAVASSDATNIATRIERDGDEYVINGHKWWISGAGDPRCRVFLVLGQSAPEADAHRRHSIVIVPRDAPGVTVSRPLTVFGYDDAPHGHCEMFFENVRVPAASLLLGEGRGFEAAQGRLGPGRIHHCMRCIGMAERALELLCRRVVSRTAFGREIARQTIWQERIAQARCMIDQARLLTFKAAWMMDTVGNKAARAEVGMIKIVAPNVACQVIDWAIQAWGAAGLCSDQPLAHFFAGARSLRIADGPDEVHEISLAKQELGKYVPRGALPRA